MFLHTFPDPHAVFFLSFGSVYCVSSFSHTISLWKLEVLVTLYISGADSTAFAETLVKS